jgi:hypothetical protein
MQHIYLVTHAMKLICGCNRVYCTIERAFLRASRKLEHQKQGRLLDTAMHSQQLHRSEPVAQESCERFIVVLQDTWATRNLNVFQRGNMAVRNHVPNRASTRILRRR